MLRLLSEELGVGVREYKNAMVAFDGPKLSAHVTWQTRMSDGIDVASAHALAGLDDLGLTDEARHDFLHGNAARVFRLEGLERKVQT